MHLYILYYTYIRITSYNYIIGRNSNAHTHIHTRARARTHARTYARKREFQFVEVLCKVKTCFSTDRRFLQKKLF